jgi:hypothetical protein
LIIWPLRDLPLGLQDMVSRKPGNYDTRLPVV